MHRQQKLLNILLGHIITCVEDMHVKPEHREDNDHAVIPEGQTFLQTCMKVLHAEAANCHMVLSTADLQWFIKEIDRVATTVRT